MSFYITFINVTNIKPSPRPNSNAITIDCDMELYDMADALGFFCEIMGDDLFIKIVKEMLPKKSFT